MKLATSSWQIYDEYAINGPFFSTHKYTIHALKTSNYNALPCLLLSSFFPPLDHSILFCHAKVSHVFVCRNNVFLLSQTL